MTSLTLPNGSAPWGGVTNDATARLPDHADNRATSTNANSAFVRTTRLAISIHVQSGLGSYLPLHGPERGHRNADNEKTLGEIPRLWPFHRYLTRTTLDGDACPLDPRPR